MSSPAREAAIRTVIRCQVRRRRSSSDAPARRARDAGSGMSALKLTLSMPTPWLLPLLRGSIQRIHRSVPGCQLTPLTVAGPMEVLPAVLPLTGGPAPVFEKGGGVKARAEVDRQRAEWGKREDGGVCPVILK